RAVAGADAEVVQRTLAVGGRVHGAHDVLADADRRAGADRDDLVAERHLALAVEEEVDLLDVRVRVPEGRALARLDAVRARADVLRGDRLVDEGLAVPGGDGA